MSYRDADQTRRAKPIIAVAAVHAVIAYGFLSGLAYQVNPFADRPIVAENIPDDVPPPPKLVPPPPRQQPARHAALARPDVAIERPRIGEEQIIEVPTFDRAADGPRPDVQPVPPTPPAHASRAQGAAILGDRSAWVTTEDYPSAALREGLEGTVGISVTIGTDGRVAACEVTAPSGSALLDQQTCRLYARRARFSPALDEDGRAIVGHRLDRVRWRVPAQ